MTSAVICLAVRFPSAPRKGLVHVGLLVAIAGTLLWTTALAQDTSDPAKIAPLEHQFREEWVGKIVPSHLIDLFAEGSFPFSRGRLQDRTFRYRLFRPRLDPDKPQQKFPLLVWASGYGEMGDDNFAQLRHLQFVFTDPENGRKKPFFCLVMQSPADVGVWSDAEGKQAGDDVAAVLVELIERLLAEERIDPDRVYLSGVSAGGGFCWDLLLRRPDLFAAAAPLAGTGYVGDLAELPAIRHVPVWAFHASADPLLPATSVEKSVMALRQAGGRAALTKVDTDFHDCWTSAFRDWRLMDWFLLQKRGRTAWLATPGIRPIDWPVVGGFLVILAVAAVAIRQEVLRRKLLVILACVPALAGCDPPPPGRAQPYGCDIFVRGTFLDEDQGKSFAICNDTNKLRYAGGTRYVCTIALPKGTHLFKVTDASWKAVNLGAWDPEYVLEPRVPYGALSGGNAQNFILKVVEPGRYLFELHASDRGKPIIRYVKEP